MVRNWTQPRRCPAPLRTRQQQERSCQQERQTLSVIFTPTNATEYAPATASVTITVNKAVPTINRSAPADIAYGTALDSMQLNATAACNGVDVSGSGTFAYSPAAGAVLAEGSHMLSVTFTPSDKTDFTTVRASVPLTVNPSPLSLTWATPKAITYGTKLTGTQLNAAATFNGKRVSGAYAYTAVDNGGGPAITLDNKGYPTMLPAGSYTLTAGFTPQSLPTSATSPAVNSAPPCN